MISNFEYLDEGNRSAAPQYMSKALYCERCNVGFVGCWDNSDCEWCGRNCLTNEDHPENPSGISRRAKAQKVSV